MKTRRKLELVVNGKYNMKAIMKKAWMYKNNPFCTQYRNDFKGALKEAWVDARLAMDEYKALQNPNRHSALVRDRDLKALLYRPGYENFDSSWRIR